MIEPSYKEVRAEIVALLDAARAASARSVNALMTASYWAIGRRIVQFEQLSVKRTEVRWDGFSFRFGWASNPNWTRLQSGLDATMLDCNVICRRDVSGTSRNVYGFDGV